MFLCPNCNARISISKSSSDYVHSCHTGNSAIDNEDVLVIGEWIDYTGSGGPPRNFQTAGVGNELQGTIAELEGEKFNSITVRGNRTGTHRTRQKEYYFKKKPNYGGK